MTCKPLLKWPGGKRSELPLIIPRVPQHTRYFEPFYGGGSVFFAHIEAPTFVNDINSDLMTFYTSVKYQDQNFFMLLYQWLDNWECSTIEEKANMYYDARKEYNTSTLGTEKRAAYFFLMRELAYGGMFRQNSAGEFNVPFGKSYGLNLTLLRRKIDNLRSIEVTRKLGLVEHLSSMDFREFLNLYDFDRDDFMFVDPPYDTSFNTYGESEFESADQRRLAEVLFSFPGKFMLVCKATPLTESLYASNGSPSPLHCYYYDCQYRFNIKGRFSRETRHILVTNYASLNHRK